MIIVVPGSKPAAVAGEPPLTDLGNLIFILN